MAAFIHLFITINQQGRRGEDSSNSMKALVGMQASVPDRRQRNNINQKNQHCAQVTFNAILNDIVGYRISLSIPILYFIITIHLYSGMTHSTHHHYAAHTGTAAPQRKHAHSGREWA